MIHKNIVIGSLIVLAAGAQILHATSSREGGDLEEWNLVGNANWQVSSELIRANSGKGFLVSTQSYKDFDISIDFLPAKNSNSGIFIRCIDPANITEATCYEVNIFDHRPDPVGRTGGIVNVAPPRVSINTEGQWNKYEISARGDHLVVKLNGVVTVDAYDAKLLEGAIALQYVAGDIQFRNITINNEPNFENDIVGVWDLIKFELDDGKGNIQSWCEGSFGHINYFNGYMSVAINCTSDPEKKLFYAGPFHLEGDAVVHNVRNFSDPSLHKVLRRQIEMPDVNSLNLGGPFGESGRVIISWKRR